MDRRLLLCTALHTGAVLAFALPAHSQPAANARPTGGSVVAGSVTITTSPTITTIDQSSQRAAINWQSFNIGSQQTVQFEQPSSSAVALNRVVGPNPSEIAGRIDANGQVVITNQSGVLFYKGSQVNTAGLMVSAAGIGNADFMAGRMAFTQAAKPNASVINQGSITVRDAGLAALVAPQVANSGVISARLGHVVLAGAEKATLDLYGDGLMAIDVTGQVVRAPNGATALVTNTGVIRADGGTIQLTAQAADGIVQTLVDSGGKLRADTVGDRTGSIVLNGVGGSITVAGQLTSTGTTAGTTGGNIEVNSSGSVTLAPSARLDASGPSGGGVVAVGTSLARASGGSGVTTKQTAANVTVAAGATIAADATVKGNGGRVAVLSRGNTTMNGAISAKGGPKGGNGGAVETSGKTLAIGSSAVVDTTAPLGLTGSWLLDPTNFTIATTGGDETPSTVVAELVKTNVTIQADNDITITDAIDATTNSGAVNSLFLQAGHSILVNASVTMNGGVFGATANDSVDLPGGTALADRSAGPGSFTMASGVTINTSVGPENILIRIDAAASNTGGGGDFTPGTVSLANLTTGGGSVTASGGTGLALSGAINAGTGDVALGAVGAGGIALDGNITTARLLVVSDGGGITQGATNSITAPALAVEATGPVNLTGPNAVRVLAAVVTGAGNGFTFRDAATPLIIGTINLNRDNGNGLSGITTNDGRVALATSSSGSITANQQINSTGGEIDIAVAPGSGFTNNTDTFANPATAINSGNGNIVVLADTMTFGANSAIMAGTGTVVLGTGTTGNNIALGAPSSAGTLGLQNADLATITAGMLEVGYRKEDATASFTGSISIGGAAGITLNPTTIPTLLLVTGGPTGTVIQTEPITFSAAGGTLGVIAGGAATLSAANTVTTFAGYADNGSTITYANVGQLTVGALAQQQLGVAVNVNGIASSAPMVGGANGPVNPLSGVTAVGGGGITLTTTSGDLRLTANVTAPAQTVALNADGQIFQTAGTITAGTLTGSSVHGATMTDNNAVDTLGPFTDVASDGTNGLTFTDGQALKTTATVKSDGQITLTTNGTGSNLTLDGNVTAIGQVVRLDSAGTIAQTAGVITAATLTGISTGGASLTGANQVAALGLFTDTGPGSTGIAFTDARALDTTGTVSSASGPIALTTTGTGSNLTLDAAVTATGSTVTLTTTSAGSNLTLGAAVTAAGSVTLDSAGTIDQTAGAITAASLTGTSTGGASLTGANQVAALGPFTDTGAGSTGIAFTDARALDTTGTVSSASGPVALTMTGTGSNLTLDAAVTATGSTVTLTTTSAGSNLTLGAAVTAAGSVTLDSAGTIDQTAGVITAASLTGNSTGGASLTDANLVPTLAAFTDTGAGSTGIAFTDAEALGTTGTVSSATGPIALTTTGTGSNLTIGAAVTATGNAVTLTTTGAGSNLTLDAAVTAAGSVALDSAGTVDQTAGVINAAGLTGTSVGGASLTGANQVATLGPFTDTGTGSTGIAFTNAEAVGTTGTVSSASGPITLTTTGAGSNLTLGAAVTAAGNTVTLDSTGTIDQTAGVITAATLTGNSTGGASLTGGNQVATLAVFTDTGPGSTGIAFTDARALDTTGTVSSVTGPVTLTTTGTGSNLTIGAAVTASGNTVTLTTTGAGSNLTLEAAVTAAGSVTLDSAGTIDQAAGVITAATLTGASVGGASLTGANQVADLGPFTDTGAGSTGIAFTDARALGTVGTVSSATGPVNLTTTGTGSNLTLGAAVTADGSTVTLTTTGAGSNMTLGGAVTAAGSVTLNSVGTIDQTAGVITAASLTGNSTGGATLTGANQVATLAVFTDTGAGSTGIAFTDARALDTTGTVSSATGPVTLTTTGAGSNLTIGAAVTAVGSTVSLTTTGAGSNLTLGAPVTAAGSVTLDSAGTIDQTGGVITAATVTGASVGGASLTGGNQVAALGPFTDTGAGSTGIAFTDARALGTAGAVSSATGSIALTTTGAGSDLTLGGDLTAVGQTVTLTSAGAIAQNAGAITAATLTGSSAGGTALGRDNAIGTLGAFTAGGAGLALFDGTALTIAGPVAADFLTITATGRMTLAGNIATIGAPLSQQSGATPALGGSTLQVVTPPNDPEAPTQFVQTGTSLLTDPPGTTLRIQLPRIGGTATFANLDGPGAELVLALGNGTATGNMEVGGLLVLGQGGSADLFGSVAGVTTQRAAALGQILPEINGNYTFNNCVIGLAACGAPTPPLLPPTFPGLPVDFFPGPVLPSVEPLPMLEVVVLVTPPLLTGELAPQDVVPPNISFEDY